ncbi:lysozyme inhibitor LprI family protein [Trinickia mobilis]|uniref:lysozyme inhibitor LprI family protein n=1 Tax=Trinickia mobilis TaxID=2816356 RepID=UPI001A8CA47E|nr:lysozyme inhibitor LprI family protein [Trinickia mobilis]
MSPGFKRGLAGALFAGACLAGLLSAGAARAEVAAADPIDTAMQQCLARADRSSTAGQVQCTEAANDAWQTAIDAAFQSVLANAPTDKVRRGWQESQRRWLAWRKDEAYLLHAVFATTAGSSYAMSAANLRLQPVRDRALALRKAAAQYQQSAQAKLTGDAPPAAQRARRCADDAACLHADFDLNRYYRTLRAKLPVRSRPALVHAERTWVAFRDATGPLISAQDRFDLIGARIATIKRFSETVGND